MRFPNTNHVRAMVVLGRKFMTCMI